MAPPGVPSRPRAHCSSCHPHSPTPPLRLAEAARANLWPPRPPHLAGRLALSSLSTTHDSVRLRVCVSLYAVQLLRNFVFMRPSASFHFWEAGTVRRRACVGMLSRTDSLLFRSVNGVYCAVDSSQLVLTSVNSDLGASKATALGQAKNQFGMVMPEGTEKGGEPEANGSLGSVYHFTPAKIRAVESVFHW